MSDWPIWWVAFWLLVDVIVWRDEITDALGGFGSALVDIWDGIVTIMRKVIP